MRVRHGIAEWYGQSLLGLSPTERRRLATVALDEHPEIPSCPFQPNAPPCRKPGGVCSIIRYAPTETGRIARSEGDPVIVCPARFQQSSMLMRWFAEIVGFAAEEAMQAREVPFMHSTATGKPAGKIDVVLAREAKGTLRWYGLEIQAVYFSGKGMRSEFLAMKADSRSQPPYPNANRRPDWRSSSAKRLMPQLQVKVPTVRRWGSKLAVAVDRPFFDSIGGPGDSPRHDLDDGDVIWLVPKLVPNQAGGYSLQRGHWEVLTLEETNAKLLAAAPVQRSSFEGELSKRLQPLE
ncbi:MAG: NotI family restriction endonuclease [Gammaproteobacteria bacterium]|nr:NotI family restriction endonuclease [Gammaproteobacteria bacterium]